jgi:cation transport protein ChaC
MTTPFLFGYGSILWRQDFFPVSIRRGILAGYQRALAQRSTDHRGTEARPGIVATLLHAPDHHVIGRLFEVPVIDFDRVFNALDHREKNGYHLIDVDVAVGSEIVPARTYIAPPGNPWYLGQQRIQDLASVIMDAKGPSGSNLDYILQLFAESLALDHVDQELADLMTHLLSYDTVVARAKVLGIQCPGAQGC